jgi:hypothetical protein
MNTLTENKGDATTDCLLPIKYCLFATTGSKGKIIIIVNTIQYNTIIIIVTALSCKERQQNISTSYTKKGNFWRSYGGYVGFEVLKAVCLL